MPKEQQSPELDPRIYFRSTPPPEVQRILSRPEFANAPIEGWFPIPTRSEKREFTPLRVLEASGLIDAHQLLEPFLDNPIFVQTLRTIDVFNGCRHVCDTCLADALPPTKMFTLHSLEALFSDPRFINMLQKDSLRFGSSGDLLNHPQAITIATLALEATQSLHQERLKQTEDKKGHRLKIMTNYRLNNELEIDKLIELGEANPDRLRITISLPLNRKDTVNHQFSSFVINRPHLFDPKKLKYDKDGLIDLTSWYSKNRILGIQDVRHPFLLFNIGRTLPDEVRREKVSDGKLAENDSRLEEQSGLVKTYLNPEALWLQMYVDRQHSHTTRLFTPFTSENVNALSHLPFHPDFTTPPNWPGGGGAEPVVRGTRHTPNPIPTFKS